MLLFFGIFGSFLALFFLVRWLMRLPAALIASSLRLLLSGVIRFVLLYLISLGGIFRFLGYLLPIFWKLKRQRQGGQQTAPRASSRMSRASAYALLGIAPTSNSREINQAWRSLMGQAHPDKGGTHEQAAKLNQARELLLKKPKR